MNDPDIVQILALVFFVGEFLGCVVFCILFGRKWRGWIHSRMGPNLFAMMFVLAVLQGIAVLRLVVPIGWIDANADVVRLFSFAALFSVVWWRCAVLWSIQHDDAREIKRKKETERAAAAADDGDNSDPDLLRSER